LIVESAAPSALLLLAALDDAQLVPVELAALLTPLLALPLAFHSGIRPALLAVGDQESASAVDI